MDRENDRDAERGNGYHNLGNTLIISTGKEGNPAYVFRVFRNPEAVDT